MNWLRFILLFKILLVSTILFAQNKQLEKANKRYQIKKYAEAIPLYEQGLAKNPNLNAKTKLAFCYRVNNNIDKAAQLYSEIVLEKRAKAITKYYYGESLMSQGKYDDARSWLKKYTDENPGDPKGWALLESIDKVQNIRPYYQVSNVEPFSNNSTGDDSAPVFFREGIIFSSDRKTGLKIMKKKSGFTGRDFLSLYYSKRKDDGSYSSASSLSKRLNNLNKNTGTIAISPDGTFAIFSRNSDISNRRNFYNLMLYRAEINSDGKFKNVRKLYFCNNNVNYMHPAFSPDGQTLFFTSDKKGVGGTDIYYSTFNGEKWSRPKGLGEPINTTANEGFPFMGSDGKLYFCSKGHPSYGGFDIFFSEKNQKGKWTNPINVGRPINSPADDISIYLDAENKKGMFASSREGEDDDIYFFNIDGIYHYDTTPEWNDQSMVESSNTTEEIIEPITENKVDDEKEVVEVIQETEVTQIEKVIKEQPEITTVVENTTEIIQATKESELTVDPVEPFQETVAIEPTKNTETDDLVTPLNPNLEEIIGSTPPTVSKSSEEIQPEVNKNDLPFMPVEPFDTKTENVDTIKSSVSKPDFSVEVIEPEEDMEFQDKPVKEWKKFEESLASVDTPMTDNIAPTNEVKEKSYSNEGLTELQDHLDIYNQSTEGVFVLEKVKFDKDQYVVTESNASYLDELVELMNKNPELKIEIDAHTESIGDDRENMIFSIKRATAVAGYMIRNGIETDRLKVMGYGETRLLNHCSNGINCNDSEHAINQRIEIKVITDN